MTSPAKKQQRYIVIDDDPVNNMICKLTIEIAFGGAEIRAFNNPAEGFDFIRSQYELGGDQTPAVLLLDINMPVMTGWEFLERFDSLKPELKDLIRIYILSSSIDERDKQRSYANKNVVAFLVKPLVVENVKVISKRTN